MSNLIELDLTIRPIRPEFGYKIFFSHFYKFFRIQKRYIFNKKIPQTLCLCEICECMVLFSKGLQMASNVHSVVEKYSCNSHSKACIIRECENCTSGKILNVDGFDGKKDVKFFKWCRENKHGKKIEKTHKCEEAIKTWTSSVMNLKQRIHRMRIQLFCLNCIKEDLKSTVLLHVDFSKCYKNANQDEIQSTYFRQSWFLIFTACAYTCTNMENRNISITVTTESNEHSRVTALSCIHKIISYIEEKVGAFTKLCIWIKMCITVQIEICFLVSEPFPP